MKTVYLGTDPSHFECPGEVIHFPVIKIIPRNNKEIDQAFAEMPFFTHLVFTSKNGVEIFFNQYQKPLKNKILVAIGKITAIHLEKYGYRPQLIATEETQEGVVALLKTENLENSYFFLPRSARSRPYILHFFQEQKIRYKAIDLYDLQCVKPEIPINLEELDQIVFTSPSTVEGFFQIYNQVPPHVKLLAIGPVTEQALAKNHGSLGHFFS